MFNWREIPLVRVLVPFVAGILLAMEMDRAFTFFDYLLLVLAFSLVFLFKVRLVYRYRWIYGILLNLFFLLMAYQLCFYHTDWNRENHFRGYIHTQENTLIGEVVNEPVFSEKQVKIHLKILQIDSVSDRAGKVLLYFKNNILSRTLNYGDQLICKTRLNRLDSPKNPLAFDYKAYLKLKNIDYQGFVYEGDWRVLDSMRGNAMLHFAFSARKLLLSVLEKYIPSENERAVASALIVGYKGDLNKKIESAYANTGAMHVLAVSGLHVGLVWGILAFVLSWFPWRHPAWKWLRMLIIIACLWAFALITGASPSVLRAATMFTFLIIGTHLDRTNNIYNTLAASALVLLAYNPFLIREVGFQLSYLAVTGIVYFYPKIYRQWYIENKAGNFIWKLTAVAIAAQLTTFPLSLYYFHQFPVYFWLSGLIVVPFAFLILGGGILLFVLELIVPFLAAYFAYLLYGVIWVMNALIFLIEQLPSGLISRVWISLAIVLLIYVAILVFTLGINTQKFKWILRATGIGVLICGILAFDSCQNAGEKNIVFYHTRGKTLLEFMDGKTAISLGDFNLSTETLKFTRDNYHFFKGINKLERYHFGNEEVLKKNWMYQDGFVQFYDKKVVCLNSIPDKPPNKRVKVDFLLIRKNANFKIKRILDYFEPGLIILDASLNQKELLEYKRACLESAIRYHDIRASGALVYKFSAE